MTQLFLCSFNADVSWGWIPGDFSRFLHGRYQSGIWPRLAHVCWWFMVLNLTRNYFWGWHHQALSLDCGRVSRGLVQIPYAPCMGDWPTFAPTCLNKITQLCRDSHASIMVRIWGSFRSSLRPHEISSTEFNMRGMSRYPLVLTNMTMGNHRFYWENSRNFYGYFMLFSIATFNYPVVDSQRFGCALGCTKVLMHLPGSLKLPVLSSFSLR